MEAVVKEEEAASPTFFIPEHLQRNVTIRRNRSRRLRDAAEKDQQRHQQDQQIFHGHLQHQQDYQQQQHLQDCNSQHHQDGDDVDDCHDDDFQLDCGCESLSTLFDSTPSPPNCTFRSRLWRGDGSGDGGSDGRHEMMAMTEMFRQSLLASTKIVKQGGDANDVDEDVTQTLLLNQDCFSEGAMRLGDYGGNDDDDGGGDDSCGDEDGSGDDSPVGFVRNSGGIDVYVCGGRGDDDGFGRGDDGICEEQSLWVTCALSPPSHHYKSTNPYWNRGDCTSDDDTEHIHNEDQIPDRDEYDVGSVDVRCVVRGGYGTGDDIEEICGQEESDDHNDADDHYDKGPPTIQDTASPSHSTSNCLEGSGTSAQTIGQKSSDYTETELKDQHVQCTLSWSSDVSDSSTKTRDLSLDLCSSTQTLGQDSSPYLVTALKDQDVQVTLSWTDSEVSRSGADDDVAGGRGVNYFVDGGIDISHCELKDQDVQVTLSWTDSEVSRSGADDDVGGAGDCGVNCFVDGVDSYCGNGNVVNICSANRGDNGVGVDGCFGYDIGAGDNDDDGNDECDVRDFVDRKFDNCGFGDGVDGHGPDGNGDVHNRDVDIRVDDGASAVDVSGGRMGDFVPLWVLSLRDAELREALTARGVSAAPVVSSTRRLMQRLLTHVVTTGHHNRPPAAPPPSPTACYSPELRQALLTGLLPDCSEDEELMKSQFDSWTEATQTSVKGGVRSRGRCVKNCFIYLLLDPRKLRAPHGGGQQFRIFVSSIFYVGKGSRARQIHHLQEAMAHRHSPHTQPSAKVARILSVWDAGHGVISVSCFHASTSAEALTRECCIIDALGLGSVCNEHRGSVRGLVSGWPLTRRRRLGVFLLGRAMAIMNLDGQREIHPRDLTG